MSFGERMQRSIGKLKEEEAEETDNEEETEQQRAFETLQRIFDELWQLTEGKRS